MFNKRYTYMIKRVLISTLFLVKGKTFKLKHDGRYITEEEAAKYSEDELQIGFEKQSKSKGNGIKPESVSQIYGVDALRAAIMFGAPPEKDLNFDIA